MFVLQDEIIWYNKNKLNGKHLLSFDLDCSAEGLAKYLKRRRVPKNRAYAHNFLSKYELNINLSINIERIVFERLYDNKK